MVLSLRDIHKSYPSGSRTIEVLRELTLEIAAGDICALVGPSGSGKTSLLGISAGLESATAGTIRLCDVDVGELNEEGRAKLRNRHIGFVFQSFQLIGSLTALENVLIPLELRGERDGKAAALSLLERVGLAGRGHHYPNQLSGGEQQRVAIARAFANQPRILFADEPTGNLDEETAATIEDLLFALHAEQGTTLFIATHNMNLARRARRLLYLEHGRIREEPAH